MLSKVCGEEDYVERREVRKNRQWNETVMYWERTRAIKMKSRVRKLMKKEEVQAKMGVERRTMWRGERGEKEQ